jgi:large subunit ribosomal protein L7/L12
MATKTKMTAEDLLDQFKEMTLLELSDFVKKFEETFDVQAAAAAPMMMAAPGAKDLVDSAPKPVLEKVNKEAADKAKEQLEGAGATVEIK